jgi:hypothetical protein
VRQAPGSTPHAASFTRSDSRSKGFRT